jgi:ABC-type branched-subunit amino acid transport system permease subunit
VRFNLNIATRPPTPARSSTSAWSAYKIFIVVVGGIGYPEGPLIGGVVFFALQQLLAGYGSWYRSFAALSAQPAFI